MIMRHCARLVAVGVPVVLITAHIVSAAPQAPRDQPTSVLATTAGRDTFRQFCAPCHGTTAHGDGPVASMLNVRPTDLTRVNRRNNGVFPLQTLEATLTLSTRMRTPAHGSEQMPVWGPVFVSVDGSQVRVNARVGNLLAYLESIQE